MVAAYAQAKAALEVMDFGDQLAPAAPSRIAIPEVGAISGTGTR